MMPNMRSALPGFSQWAEYKKASRELTGYRSVETLAAPQRFRGVFTPMNPQRLMVKPEGERRWKWTTLYASLEMFLGDVVEGPDGVTYKVMGKNDWSASKFFSYELTERKNVSA